MSLTSAGKIGFIGGGNMAEAFIKGLITGGCPVEHLLFFEPNSERRQLIEQRYGIASALDNQELVTASEIIVLATKPQILDQVLAEIVPAFNDDKLLISILAGTRTTTLEKGLGGRPRVVRAMPNTPALAGHGAAALCAGSNIREEDRRIAEEIFEAVGIALWVEEKQMDTVTGLSGSGPAFVFSFIEALAAGGVDEGLPAETAQALAVQTVIGAARLVAETGEAPALLRQKVCSPGGTTISGVNVLEDRGLHTIVMDAVRAATRRSRQLGKGK